MLITRLMDDISREDKINYIFNFLKHGKRFDVLSNLEENNFDTFEELFVNISDPKLIEFYDDIIRLKNSNKKIEDSLYEFTQIMTCSITLEIMDDPWTIQNCNHTFEKTALISWYLIKNYCPLCKNKFDLTKIKPNYILKNMPPILSNVFECFMNRCELLTVILFPYNISITIGDFKNLLPHGYCKFYIIRNDGKNGISRGSWKDGKMNGENVAEYPNGNIYEGNCKDNKRDGLGIMTYPDGSREEGYWKDNNFLQY